MKINPQAFSSLRHLQEIHTTLEVIIVRNAGVSFGVQRPFCTNFFLMKQLLYGNNLIPLIYIHVIVRLLKHLICILVSAGINTLPCIFILIILYCRK